MARYRRIDCNLCGSDNFKIIYKAKDNADSQGDCLTRKFRSSGDEALIDQMVTCRNCGLSYINPVLDEPDILMGYSEGADEVFVSQNRARERTFKKCLKAIGAQNGQGKKILDIGTAAGAFLHVARQKGWQVYGCEPNEWMCRWAKEHYGLDIVKGTVFDLFFEDSFFDVITLWDVLEHTSDPKQVLRRCFRLLKPRGLLIINYPDIGSWIARLMGRRWVFLLSVHLFYFTKKTISSMFRETGFAALKFRPHFQYLKLDYIFQRAKPYIGPAANFFLKITDLLRLGNLLVPYWMGQTLVLARKAENEQ